MKEDEDRERDEGDKWAAEPPEARLTPSGVVGFCRKSVAEPTSSTGTFNPSAK